MIKKIKILRMLKTKSAATFPPLFWLFDQILNVKASKKKHESFYFCEKKFVFLKNLEPKRLFKENRKKECNIEKCLNITLVFEQKSFFWFFLSNFELFVDFYEGILTFFMKTWNFFFLKYYISLWRVCFVFFLFFIFFIFE